MRSISITAVGMGMATTIGGALLSGSLIGMLASPSAAQSGTLAELPAPLAAATAAGLLCTFLGGYVCALMAPQAKRANAAVLGALATAASFIGAVIEFHVVTPVQTADYIAAALVPFVLPLTMLGAAAALRRLSEPQPKRADEAPARAPYPGTDDDWDWIPERDKARLTT